VSFQTRIDEHRSSLTRTDQLLIDQLLSHPADAALWRGEEVAHRTGVHPSAATRLAQRLGYRGYLELRQDLRVHHDELITGSGAGDRFRRELAEVGEGSVLDALLTTEVDSLTTLRKHVTQDRIDRAADLLATARTVHLFARGNASVLTEMAERRLRRFARPTVVLDGGNRDVAEKLLQLGTDDVLLVFAFRRSPQHLASVLDHADRVGARIILITDTLHSHGVTPTLVLAAPRGHQEGFASLTVPMTVTNAIVLTMAARHSDTILPALDRLDGLLETLDE